MECLSITHELALAAVDDLRALLAEMEVKDPLVGSFSILRLHERALASLEQHVRTHGQHSYFEEATRPAKMLLRLDGELVKLP